MKLSEKIKLIRKTEGYTQVEFSKIMGVNPQTIKNYEYKYRKTNSDFLLKLCKQFPQYTNWLMGTVDHPPTINQNNKTIDFLDVKASAGSGLLYLMSESLKALPLTLIS